jgi:predicted alpha/beta superfamily hydrolase
VVISGAARWADLVEPVGHGHGSSSMRGLVSQEIAARSGWRDYRSTRGSTGLAGSTVVGDLRVLRGLASPQLGVSRDILVHLPAGALESGRRYPVLYMHDGQNLFDAATSFAGEWQVDETLMALAEEGLELIIVGIPNGAERRYAEYTPYRGRGRLWPNGGFGRAYLRFLVDTVKPLVDSAFPTRTDRGATGIMGSSLGGLISARACVEHGATFGLVGAMSPAIPGDGTAMVARLRNLDLLPERVHLDVGGREGSDSGSDPVARRWAAAYPRDALRIRAALLESGLREPAGLRFVQEPDGIHHESAWGPRLPDALRFLYGR